MKSFTEAAKRASRWIWIKRSKKWANAAGTQTEAWSAVAGSSEGLCMMRDPKHPSISGNINDDVSHCIYRCTRTHTRILLLLYSPATIFTQWGRLGGSSFLFIHIFKKSSHQVVFLLCGIVFCAHIVSFTTETIYFFVCVYIMCNMLRRRHKRRCFHLTRCTRIYFTSSSIILCTGSLMHPERYVEIKRQKYKANVFYFLPQHGWGSREPNSYIL